MSFRNLLGEYLSYFTLLPRVSAANRAPSPGTRVSRISYGDHPKQYLLLFSPEQPSGRPWVFFIHGGGWRHGSPDGFRFIGHYFARLGFTAVLPAYRLAPGYRYPAQAEDIFQAHREAAGRIGSAESVVVGVSAGAHLGAVLVYDRVMQARFGVDQQRFRGYCSICGPVSLADCRNPSISKMLRDLLPPGGDRSVADPCGMVHGDEGIPVLCLHGRHDPLVEVASAEAFARRIGSSHARLHIEEAQGVYHSNLACDTFLGRHASASLLQNWLMEVTAAAPPALCRQGVPT